MEETVKPTSETTSTGVSLLIGHSLNADVNLVLADDGGQLIVANVAIKSFEFWVVVVYVPNIAVERVSFYQLFLDDLKWLVLMGDWNAILDPKIDRVRRGARSLGRCERSLINFMACHDLVDRFRLDHPGKEMLMWLDRSSSVCIRSYLYRVLVKRADTDFVVSHIPLYSMDWP